MRAWAPGDRGHHPAFPGCAEHPQRLHGEPMPGARTHCASTEQAAFSPRGHRAGGPWTLGGDAGGQAATLDRALPGLGGHHKHQYFSAHARAGLHNGSIIIRDRRLNEKNIFNKALAGAAVPIRNDFANVASEEDCASAGGTDGGQHTGKRLSSQRRPFCAVSALFFEPVCAQMSNCHADCPSLKPFPNQRRHWFSGAGT